MNPELSVIIPSFNNLPVLRRCVESWRDHAGDQPVELLVIEDGCRDGTSEYLREVCRTGWGLRHVRWFHEDDVNELRCDNRGFAESRAPLLLVWQDDMFLRSRKLVPELFETFRAYPEIGLLALSRGLDCFPLDEPIRAFEDLLDWRRLRSTIGRAPWNWLRLQEVDIVIRPWVTRRECVERAGPLDEIFCPHEWDEADYCFRLRAAGWRVATHGYERARFYHHVGSSSLSKKPAERQQRISLENGLKFHERWAEAIREGHSRPRRTWWRRPASLAAAFVDAPRVVLARKLAKAGDTIST